MLPWSLLGSFLVTVFPCINYILLLNTPKKVQEKVHYGIIPDEVMHETQLHSASLTCNKFKFKARNKTVINPNQISMHCNKIKKCLSF